MANRKSYCTTTKQSLFFAAQSFADYKLLELDEAVLQALTEQDSAELVFRGESEEFAVLCSADKTYDIKEAEVSNNFLLFSSLQIDGCDAGLSENAACSRREVCGIFGSYLEPRCVSGKTNKLQKLFQANKYRHRQDASQGNTCMFSLKDLLQVIQASESEICAALQNLHVCNINGRYAMLDLELESAIVSGALNILLEKNWSYKSFNLQEMLDLLLLDYLTESRLVLEGCLKWFTVVNDDGATRGFDEEKLSKLQAAIILQPTGKFNLGEFLQVWQHSLPLGLKIDHASLKGLAIINNVSIPPTIQYLNCDDMPDSVEARFERLFEAKTYWSEDEIRPYLSEFLTPKLELSDLLLKHAKLIRSSFGANKTKTYMSRKPL